MTLDILICTIDDGITKVPSVFLDPVPGIRYIVSMQYTSDNYKHSIPEEITSREDVVLTMIEGRGLSRNRNNAIKNATADILLIADDDNRYTQEELQTIIESYECNEDADIICFMAEGYCGTPMKVYPTRSMSYAEAFNEGYYLSSIEMTMRSGLDIWFDERFGLGSPLLCAGEEDVFMKDAIDAGYEAIFIPEVIVHSDFETTGSHFQESAKMQITKGATFKYVFGVREAIWRSIKESLYHFVHHHANPFPIFRNMLKGIWILQ